MLEKVQLILFLINNLDVFVWNTYEAPRVNPNFICHRLNVDPRCPPKKQKPCRSSDIHVKTVRGEMDKHEEVGAIKEVYYPEWLANTVVVKKNN